ncbi:MAG: glycosyltransferase family 2 protein [Clostridia bacterium]|nr:glycosyltransferase family 2 protein [Clostridia bacterium]
MKVLIIIPAYNEQENIRNTVADIEAQCPEMDYIVINDCSTDGTERILKENRMHYLSLPCNLGIGGGVQTGYRYARDNGYDIAIQFDGDGQHEAKYLRDLIRPITEDRADIAIGSRFINHQGFQSSGLRRLGIRLLSGLIRLLCGVTVLDVTSGMRAVNRRFIEYYAVNYAQDYPEPEAIVMAAKHGAKIAEIPVEMRERQGGASSISPNRSIYYMIKVSLALILAKFTA